MIEATPYIEPLIAAMSQRRWCVMLVNRRSARLMTGPTAALRERERLDEGTHGQHDQGGWSQANYERSIEKDADDHLRHAAGMLHRRWRRERFDRLALGGPPEIVPRLEAMLGDDERAHLAAGRLDVNVGGAARTRCAPGSQSSPPRTRSAPSATRWTGWRRESAPGDGPPAARPTRSRP
jgi:hypothetical protein